MFSEPVIGFAETDMVVANATVQNFQTVRSTDYLFDLVPSGEGLGEALVGSPLVGDDHRGRIRVLR